MKTKLLIKLIVVLSLCLAVVFVFAACKDKEIYADSDDFQSYPEYWNDFNKDDSGDIVLPNGNVSSGSSDTPGEDPNANFTPDDEDEDDATSSVTDTEQDKDSDGDGTPDVDDPDDDNDGAPDVDDPDDDNDGIPDTEEKPDYGNQGPLVFF